MNVQKGNHQAMTIKQCENVNWQRFVDETSFHYVRAIPKWKYEQAQSPTYAYLFYKHFPPTVSSFSVSASNVQQMYSSSKRAKPKLNPEESSNSNSCECARLTALDASGRSRTGTLAVD